jgi:TatD DNase family protein
LDYYRNLSPAEEQRQAFRDQLQLAVDLAKPIIVHCRDAFSDVYDDIDASGHDRVVLHCWTGGPKWTKRFAGLGVTFSFAGPITFQGGDTVRLAAAAAPHERVMVETDTPFLTPPPDRSAANEPANVVRVGEALAQVWELPADEVAAMTSAEADRVFRG